MKAIEDFFNIYQSSAWDKNADAMISLYDEQALIFDMWDNAYINNPSAWSATIKDWFDSLGDEKVKVGFEMIQVHQSGHVGFASALIAFQAISPDGAVLRSMKNRITLGFVQSGDTWKVIHQHTSAPVRSDGLTAILEL